MSDAENPLDPFKRATTATIRAIAGDDELDVTFGAGPPVVRGGTLRLPLPSVGADQSEIDAVRGVGDEFALRFKHHNPRLHSLYSPDGGPAQEMFEWIESARIASLGAMRMKGVAQNLDAHLEVQCKQAAFDTITAESDAPLSVAVGLLVRQQLTGRELPPSAEHVVQYWREHVMENAGEHIEALRDHVADQDTFASLCRNIIADLGLPIDLTDPNEGENNSEDMDTMDQSEEADSEFSPEDVVLDEDSAGEENSDGDATTVEMDAHADMDEAASESDPDEAPMPMPDDAGRIPVDNNYQAYTERFDEIIKAEELCDPDELMRLRQLLDQQLVILAACDVQACQSPAAPPNGQAESHVGIRSRGRHFGCGTIDSGRGGSDEPTGLQTRKRNQVSRYGRYSTHRQFGLDAWTFDYHRCDVCRHHGPYLGTMLGAGGNLGLYHSGLARW
jgi:cobaltochelatase CobT